MRPLRCALFSVCILLCGHAPAAEPAAEKIKLPLPWKQGEVLHYATERVKTETAPGKREKSVATSKGTVATLEAGKDGYLQQWSWSESKEEVLEGDKSRQAAFAQAAAELEKIALLVEMDAEGHYSRLRNVDGIGQQMLGALRPILLKQVDDELQKQSAAMDAAQRAKARQASMDMLDAFLKRFAEPRMLENLLTKDIQNVLAFSGAELENDQAYELETQLENPTGGAAFPAKLSFGLYEDEEQPEDVWLEWTLEIDPVKGAAAVWDTVERMYGRKIGDAERKALPAQVSIVDKGFMLFERASGLPELYQNVRTSKLGEHANYERNRMRLLERGHGHEWLEQNPQETEPEMTAMERDAQLCADEQADDQAAIAACSRMLEDAGLAPQERARWHASRAAHRSRMRQHAEAVADFDKAIALQPQRHDYYIGRARAHGAGGDHQAALADAGKAAALAPESAQAQLLLGAAHEGLKDYPRAAEDFGRAIALAPQDARGHDARCWVRAMAGDLAGAKADCDRALELDAGSSNSYNSRGYVNFRAGRFAESVHDYDAALAAQPAVASSWYVRGLAKRALGDAAGAEADIAKGLALDPKVAERYAGYGVK